MLHDSYVTLVASTQASAPTINLHDYSGPFGRMFLSSMADGLTHLFFDDEEIAISRIRKDYPNARIARQQDAHQRAAMSYFDIPNPPQPLRLALKGTPFQMQVWKALLGVAAGQRSTYKALAEQLGRAKAYRAVGTAVGRNPVAFIVPCHRILASDGGMGGYYWGLETKRELLDWEANRF